MYHSGPILEYEGKGTTFLKKEQYEAKNEQNKKISRVKKEHKRGKRAKSAKKEKRYKNCDMFKSF